MYHSRRFLIATLTLAATTASYSAYANFEEEPNCSREAGSLPSPELPPGTPNPEIPIEHIQVIMQENHSFDNFFGRLNREDYYGNEIDGVDPKTQSNPDEDGSLVRPFTLEKYCVKDTSHGWNASWKDYNNGANDGFVKVNNHDKKKTGYRAMGHYEPEDMPYYYALANNFTVGDRFFSSLLGPTYPNRYFLLSGTAFGHIGNKYAKGFPFNGWTQKTIFEQLSESGVTWKYYFPDIPVLLLYQPLMKKFKKNIGTVSEYYRDLKKGTLPQVAFIESSVILGDEHPPFNFQISQYFVAKRINALMKSKYWKKSALFLTYDEGGGYFDHVPPPKACVPDDIKPMLEESSYKGDYDRYGFRVPFVAVSPYAKRHHVSHEVFDHTSILKFIETKFNIPALTKRDANANAMLDLFDFKRPNFSTPEMPKAKVSIKRLFQCLNPNINRPTPEAAEQIATMKAAAREAGLLADGMAEEKRRVIRSAEPL